MIRMEIICRHVKLNQWIHRFMIRWYTSWVSFLVRWVIELRSTTLRLWLVKNEPGDIESILSDDFSRHKCVLSKRHILGVYFRDLSALPLTSSFHNKQNQTSHQMIHTKFSVSVSIFFPRIHKTRSWTLPRTDQSLLSFCTRAKFLSIIWSTGNDCVLP
jgi:hypothetical protein